MEFGVLKGEQADFVRKPAFIDNEVSICDGRTGATYEMAQLQLEECFSLPPQTRARRNTLILPLDLR